MSIDLTDVDTIKYGIYASRTGSNIKIGIHDVEGTTTEHTANISSANTWEIQTWDISGVSNANKDAIDSIIITILNADAINTFYIDDFYGVFDYSKTFSDDVVTLTEPTFIKALAVIYSDVATLSEVIQHALGKNLVETTTLTEVFQRSITLQRWVETATLSEVAQKAISFIISEITTLSDAVVRAMSKTPIDTVTLSEVFLKAITLKRWVDTLTITEISVKSLGKTLLDTYSLTEAFNKWYGPTAKTTSWSAVSEEADMWTKETGVIAWSQL